MDSTPRLGLTFLSAGQAQKELLVNESLQTLDLLVAGLVEEVSRDTPPTDAQVGACYIIGADPTGEWAGKAHNIAALTGAGWRFIEPAEGMTFQVRSTWTCAMFNAGVWQVGDVRGSRLILGGRQVVGEQGDAIPAPSGGTMVDTEARNVIGQILGALRQHGLIDV